MHLMSADASAVHVKGEVAVEPAEQADALGRSSCKGSSPGGLSAGCGHWQHEQGPCQMCQSMRLRRIWLQLCQLLRITTDGRCATHAGSLLWSHARPHSSMAAGLCPSIHYGSSEKHTFAASQLPQSRLLSEAC